MTMITNIPAQIDANTFTQNLPTYDARDMVISGTQARIVLDGTAYYLRITRAGKLILTK